MGKPKLRFRGYTDDWEQRKVGDISTITAGGTPSTKEISYWEPKEIPWLASGEVHKKYVHDTEEKISEEGLKNSSAKWVKEGSVLIALAGQGKTRGTAAITRVPITTNQSIAAIKFDDILDADYAFHNLDSRYEELRGISSGDGTRGGLNKQLLSDLAIMFPQIDEQVKIGQYFTNLDNLITLHQRKCDEMKKLKKYMLQKMFPKKGMAVPEIRFDGFTDDWEQRKFSDIAETRRGLTYRPENIVSDGKRVLRSSNINEDYFELHNDDVFVEENAVNIPYIKNGDILITSANGSSRLVGKHAIIKDIPENTMVHGGFMLLASSEEPDFLNASMSSHWYSKFINIYVAGGNGAIGNLSKSDLDEQIIFVPSNDEQKQIGDYFRNLDNLITLHQRKCEELQKLKKFMLQNMFV